MQNIRNPYKYTMPTKIVEPFSADMVKLNIALFLAANARSILGQYVGVLRPRDQETLFGKFVSRKSLTIDGAKNKIFLTHEMKKQEVGNV